MARSVSLVEFTAFEKTTPLASGCLLAYARADPVVDREFSFRIWDAPASVEREEFAAELAAEPADVYALSCYVWNMGLTRWLLDRLRAANPNAQFILGGPQVMSHAHRYVPPEYDNVVVCNGEGERTFRDYLRQLAEGRPDFSAVPGISFWHDGELVTTQRPERIKDLTEIPSPYTTGVFDPERYTYAILETNRGCPFNCGFCFWGAATNAKVNRFETDRILGDIDWISANKMMVLYMADANWGMAPRDVEITRHVIDNRERTGYPQLMGMNAAKNKPDRVSEITRMLIGGGMLSSQPISLQSMDGDVLDLINRSNIRAETYTRLHRTLHEEQISSYTEMIWPLPGETVGSFRRGLAELCRARADTIVVYPHLLLNNTPIYESREGLGITVRRVPDDAAEADVVVATNWVGEAQYEEGMWLNYSLQTLYGLRGLYYLANYLDHSGQVTFDDLFTRAAEYFAAHREDSEFCRFIADSVAELGSFSLLNSGTLIHMALHANRAELDRLLADFVASQAFHADPTARALCELDLLARPYVYREKPRLPQHTCTELTVSQRKDVIEVIAPEEAVEVLRDLELLTAGESHQPLELRHPFRRKLPFMSSRGLHDNLSYCEGMALQLRAMLPEWSFAPALVT